MTEYKRAQGKSYMVIKKEIPVKGYEYPMITENRLSCLLPVHIMNSDNEIQFWYDISGRQSFDGLVKIKKPKQSFLRNFFTALANALEQTGEYLLDEDGISLEPEQIFLDSEENGIVFCYRPFEKISFEDGLRCFMEYYLSHMEHSERENVKSCYDVYERCQKGHVSIEGLLQILYENPTWDSVSGQRQAYETPEDKRILETPKKRWDKKFSWDKKFLDSFFHKLKRKKQTQTKAYSFEPEEVVEDSPNPTVFLGSETNQTIGELKYEGEGEEQNIKITSSVFVIGSQKEEADGVILNDTVSRIHAKITREEDSYYIEDMNSTNGTYCNGELLNYKEKTLLQKNDRIAFAKELYRFV